MLLPKIIGLICLFAVASGQNLPADEVESLRIIGRILNKTDWDFSVDPCNSQSGWVTTVGSHSLYANNVTCNCSFVNNTICHVVSIILQTQNLTGTVPRELVRLPFLQQIDLTRNFLNGTIPPEWGSLSLVNISLLGNRITGPLPRQLANISTLVSLALDYNQLSGTIPEEFGSFSRIERILLTSNNLTGELPSSLANLTSLRDFRISDNNFTGSIPNFIQNWTSITRIAIQASGLSGPIPSGIASLTNLTDLRISDLNGNESTFPLLGERRQFRILILRSCNIVGQLPSYIGQMRIEQYLDLSFNRLTGPIDESFSELRITDYIYLTGNNLDGPAPTWMLRDAEDVDLSYNNLTENSTQNCQPRERLNLFASSTGNTTGTACFSRCTRTFYSFHINCGGGEIGDYEDDRNPLGPSNFFRSTTNWGISSTGHFLDDDSPTDTYISSTGSSISGQNPELYMNARLSPLSLTYYGICLQNGNYTVSLHFAEITFTDDETYSSVGRRIFDIYIQGERVMRDFNIEREAGGVNRAIIRNFTAVVSDGTLDIRFYWAGRGTTGIPVRGVYGPLISAISVNSNFPVPRSYSLSAGAIVGIVLGVLSAVVLVLVILWWKGCFTRKDTLEYELKGVDLQTTSFTLRQLKAATNNFDPANKIGEGGFGPVFKGLLSDGTAIAVKQLSAKSKQGNREFVTEIGMISALQHPHLVKLYGCCIEGNQLLLIYEYLENNSLARALFGPEDKQIHLDWPMRHKICVGIARGLAYLHEESVLKIVHRDIKATNVLLDNNLFPKISDFGLAKLDEEENTHISTRVAGTYGYMAPEYAMRGYLTDKADVYSYGVVLLEVISGRPNTTFKTKDDCFYLLDWANTLNENGNLMDLVDPRLESNFKKEEVLTSIKVALLCTNVVSTERPSMSSVVSMLEGKVSLHGFVSYSSVSVGKTKHEEVASLLQDKHSIGGEGQNMDVPSCTGASSASASSDVCPVALDSSYLDKRG